MEPPPMRLHVNRRSLISLTTVCLVACTVLTGCYEFVEAPGTRLPPGEGVRVYLTRAGADVERLEAAGIPIQSGLALDGTIASWDDERLLLRVPTATRQVGAYQSRISLEVPVIASDIVRVEHRQLNRFRTALAAAGTLGAAAMMVAAIMSDAQSPEPPFPGDPGDGDEARLPLIRWTIPMGPRFE